MPSFPTALFATVLYATFVLTIDEEQFGGPWVWQIPDQEFDTIFEHPNATGAVSLPSIAAEDGWSLAVEVAANIPLTDGGFHDGKVFTGNRILLNAPARGFQTATSALLPPGRLAPCTGLLTCTNTRTTCVRMTARARAYSLATVFMRLKARLRNAFLGQSVVNALQLTRLMLASRARPGSSTAAWQVVSLASVDITSMMDQSLWLAACTIYYHSKPLLVYPSSHP